MNKPKLSKIASAIVIAVGLSTSAMAADTSSSMRGKILSPTGEAATNVKITVIHEPSKTSQVNNRRCNRTRFVLLSVDPLFINL